MQANFTCKYYFKVVKLKMLANFTVDGRKRHGYAWEKSVSWKQSQKEIRPLRVKQIEYKWNWASLDQINGLISPQFTTEYLLIGSM